MILYFSATGNCKYAAVRLASALGQEAVSVADCILRGAYSFTDSLIGIISPTYFWGLPSIVKEFLEKAEFHTDYLFLLSTYGTTPGASDSMAGKAIRGRSIDAFYSVRMADTWTPIFDLSTPEKAAAFTRTTEAEIDEAIRKISARHTNRRMSPRTPALLVEWFAQPLYNGRMRRTSHFRVEEGCIGCGLCAKKCPVQAIELRGGRPVWSKEKCALCLGCLHRCPRFAIQYGRRTKEHGQYTNPNVTI